MGSFYPVIRMRDRYQLEGGCSQISDGILIWLESGELSYCLFVDELLGGEASAQLSLPLQHQAERHRRMHDPGGWQYQHHLGYLQPLHPRLTHFY